MESAPFKYLFWNVNESHLKLTVSITSGFLLCCRPCYENTLNYDKDKKCQKLTTV